MERDRETHFSTVQARPRTPARLPGPHGHQIRPYHPGAPPGQRSQAALRLTIMGTTPPAIDRLKKRREFLYCAQGKKAVRSGVVIQARQRDGALRLGAGFTATKKVGNSVVRNRVKRRLREAARLLLPLHGRPGFDYVFIARATTADRAWPHLLPDVESALVSLASDEAPGNAKQRA